MVEVTEFEIGGFFVKVTREEAMRIIETLAKQIIDNRINGGRTEFVKRTPEDVSYFTIGVKEEHEPPHESLHDIYDYMIQKSSVE